MMKREWSMIMDLEKRVLKLEKQIKDEPVVKFRYLTPLGVLPRYATPGSAGMDLYAANEEPLLIFPDATVLVPLGFAMELPPGYEAQVRPRSGLAVQGVAVANSPGTIDSDYRGEVKVIIRNHGQTLTVHKGDKIAQMVIARVVQAKVVETADALSETERGVGGFGSTGTR
jgi:dUTP pyrophosphatase